MIDVCIVGVGTAVPKNIVDQASIRTIIQNVFHNSVEDLARLLNVFDHEHIHTRHFVQPVEWYTTPHGFAESNAVYSQAAVQLATEAARKAIQGREAEVAAIVVVSTTGIMTPSLDAALIQTLGLSPNVVRIPIFGLGCAAGVAGLARAAELSRVLHGKLVVFVAVEICSVTFQHSDTSRSNIIGSSIFGDGAAAVCVGAGLTGPIIMGGYSTLFPNTEDIMGWDVSDTGLRVRFSRDIPTFVRSHLPQVLVDACASWGIDVEDIGSFIAHPGGAKVLEAYADATGKPRESFHHAFDVLRENGNMSSVSVLFVLERWLNDTLPRSRYAVMSALGPGFSAEQVLLKNEFDA